MAGYDDNRRPKRPMLAAKASAQELREAFRLHGDFWAFPKLDGIRGLATENLLLSRSLKAIPNHEAQRRWAGELTWGLDGELLATQPWEHSACRIATSVFMTRDGVLPRESRYHVFDTWFGAERPFHKRYHEAFTTAREHAELGIVEVGFQTVRSEDEMLEFEASMLELGYEGLILRLPTAEYKAGRSTIREGGMIKVKRVEDAEATVVGMVELEHNGNAAQVDRLGLTRRSSAQEGKFGGGVLGALVCETDSGVVFHLGTGFDAAEREVIWKRRHEYLGKLVKYQYFGHGTFERPRHPRFIGWRDRDDK